MTKGILGEEAIKEIDSILLEVAGWKKDKLAGWYQDPRGYTVNHRPEFAGYIEKLKAIMSLRPDFQPFSEEAVIGEIFNGLREFFRNEMDRHRNQKLGTELESVFRHIVSHKDFGKGIARAIIFLRQPDDTCEKCGGSGKIRKVDESQILPQVKREIEWIENCPTCKGTGKKQPDEKVREVLERHITQMACHGATSVRGIPAKDIDEILSELRRDMNDEKLVWFILDEIAVKHSATHTGSGKLPCDICDRAEEAMKLLDKPTPEECKNLYNKRN